MQQQWWSWWRRLLAAPACDTQDKRGRCGGQLAGEEGGGLCGQWQHQRWSDLELSDHPVCHVNESKTKASARLHTRAHKPGEGGRCLHSLEWRRQCEGLKRQRMKYGSGGGERMTGDQSTDTHTHTHIHTYTHTHVHTLPLSTLICLQNMRLFLGTNRLSTRSTHRRPQRGGRRIRLCSL